MKATKMRLFTAHRGDGFIWILEMSHLYDSDRDSLNDRVHKQKHRQGFMSGQFVRRLQVNDTLYFIEDHAYLTEQEHGSLCRSIHAGKMRKANFDD